MKKLFVLFVCMSLFLCGCSELTDGSGSSATKETFPEYYADEETRVRYESESEFLGSDFCDEMKQNGYTIYLLSYDEERYEFLGMLSDRNLYKYRLTDKETGAEVNYSISYNVGYLEHPSDAFANADDTSKDVSTTVEKDGQQYDVYISRTPYVEEDEYGIVYLPFEDYKVSIYADASTPEDALSYIHDFDLVPAENTAPTEKVYLNEVRTIEYRTIPDFLESESCKAIQSEGIAVHLPSYDAAQYELRRITSDDGFYEFSFIETATGKNVVYSVLYRTCFKSADEFAQLYPDTADENILTSVEKDGVSQDAYIVKTQLTEDSCCYNLSYLPMEGYEVYIGSNSATPEEALAYIHDFDLVPAEETVEQPTETQAAASGEELAYYVDADNTTFYTSEEEFFSSEFCQTMRDNGFVPYRLSYDTEQYQFFNIRSDAKFYNYNLNDRETGERLSVTITYDTYRKDVSEFGDNVRIPMETTITTAVKDDVEYDIYVYQDPYETEPEYSLRCLPIEGYEFTISSKCATEEEVIALFQQLDLVPASE